MSDFKKSLNKFIKDPVPDFYKGEILKASCAIAANVGLEVSTNMWDIKKNQITSKILLDQIEVEQYIISIAKKYGDYILNNYPELLKTGEVYLDE